MVFLSFLGLLVLSPNAHALDVSLLTPTGPRLLKTFASPELKALANRNGQISAQKLIFDESTGSVDLNERANIDLVTLYGETGIARVPRFLIWRGFFKLNYGRDGNLSSSGEVNRLLVPSEIFNLSRITRIELSRASQTYPGTRLTIRTNPAASRGEKLFTQSCLACHSLPKIPALPVTSLTEEKLSQFSNQHKKWGQLNLDPKALRGLVAYREALSVPKTEVKSLK